MLKIAENHFVNGNKVKPPYPDNHKRLIVGMGCFWGGRKNVLATRRRLFNKRWIFGWKNKRSTYREVCSGTTDHAEVVLVIYDSQLIGLENLLRVFWEGHDPTQFMRQGNDVGSQYRSIIFYDDEPTHEKIKSSRDQYQTELSKGGFGEIVTR